MHWRYAVLGLVIWVAAVSTAAAQPAGFAGSESCKVCHEDIYNGFAKSPHHSVETDAKRGWEGRASRKWSSSLDKDRV